MYMMDHFFTSSTIYSYVLNLSYAKYLRAVDALVEDLDGNSDHFLSELLFWVDSDFIDFIDETFKGLLLIVGLGEEQSDLVETGVVEVESVALELFDDVRLVEVFKLHFSSGWGEWDSSYMQEWIINYLAPGL